MAEKLTREGLYSFAPPNRKYGVGYKAKWDGQPKRYPKKGEYFLSGSPIEAHLAYNDMSTPYYMVTIVKVKLIQTYVEVG